MPTFILKKYENNKQDAPNGSETKANTDEIESNKEENKDLIITISGTIAEIVCKALNKTLDNKIIIEQTEKYSSPEATAVSTEDINKDPISTFNDIQKDSVIFIHNRGFKTTKEEWFLTNISNKSSSVHYSVEGFVSYVKTRLGITNED